MRGRSPQLMGLALSTAKGVSGASVRQVTRYSLTGDHSLNGDRAPGIRLTLIDGFQLIVANRVIQLPMSAQRLVAFMALQNRIVSRVYLAGVLWPDTTEQRSTANLRTSLWRVRRSNCNVLRVTSTHIALDPGVLVDVCEVRRRAEQLLGDPQDDAALNLSRFTADVLPDWYDDWVVLERERFRQLRLHLLEALCDRLTSAGQFRRAVEAGFAAVSGEPLRESAQRALIAAHMAEGNRSEALRQYELYRQLLQKELRLRPSSLLVSLIGELNSD